MRVGTITHSLLPRGYSQLASCLRRDPNKGTERKRPYSPRSRPLKVALLRMDRTDIAACNPRFVRPISIQTRDKMRKIVLFCLGRFPILSLCLRHQSQPTQIVEACVSDADGEAQMLSSGVFSDGYMRMARGRSSSELTKTRAVTIDQLADQFGTPTHIKIDVEGYEGAD